MENFQIPAPFSIFHFTFSIESRTLGGFLYFSIVSPKKLCYNANIYNYFYKQEIFTYE